MMRCNNTISETRVEWLDCAKGIGAFLVILGHTYYIPAELKSFIYSFHMPLFFILAGMTMKVTEEAPWSKIVAKYAKAYLIPYVILADINLVLQSMWLLLIGELTWSRIYTYVAGTLYCYANMNWMPNCSPIWFLLCIFLSKLLFLVIMRKVPSALRLPAIAGCAVISYALYLADCPRLPWNSATALMGVAFLWIGWWLRNKGICDNPLPRRRAIAFGLVLLVLTPMLIANGGNVGMNENSYGNLLLFFVGGAGYSFVVIALSHKLDKVRFFTSFLGRNTMIVIGFNYFARHAATEIYYLIPGIRNIPINAWSLFCGTFLILACMIICWNGIVSRTAALKEN